MFKGRLPLWLESDDDEPDEYVDHEEGDDDDVDEVEESHDGAVVVTRTDIYLVRVDRDVQDPEQQLV